MSAHGVFSADARPILDTIAQIRREFNSLKKLSTQIKIGGASGGGSNPLAAQANAAAAQSRAATAAANAQAAATRAATAAIKQQDVAARASANAQKVAAAQARAATNQQAAATKAATNAQKSAAASSISASRAAAAELRKQKQLGADWAREIQAGWNQSGQTMNRFGQMTKTVTGYLKGIERNISVGFRVDPRGNLKQLRAQIIAAQKAAGALDVDLNTAKAKLQLDELMASFRKLDAAARVNVTLDDHGVIKRASISQNNDAERRGARSQLAQGVSTAATGGGLALGAGLALAMREGIKFEDAFADVRKTVSGSRAELDRLALSLRKMSTEIPISSEELSQIAANAGQLGVQSSSITKFTRTVADLSVATKLTSDEAGTDMAKLANITRLPQDEFDRLGSTIAKLGNIGASTEKEMLDMALRIAGAGHIVGMTDAQILGISNGLASLGIEAEMGGSAFSRAMIKIAKDTNGTSKEMHLFAAISGQSIGDFKNLFDHNATEAVTRFMEGLGKLPKSQIFAALDALGLKSIRIQDTMLRAAGAGDLIRQSVEAGTAAWARNNDLTTMAQKRYQSLQSQVKITQNQMADIGVEVSQTLAPSFRVLIRDVRGAMSWFKSLDDGTKENIVRFVAYSAAALLVIGRISTLMNTIALLRLAFGGATAAAGTTTLASRVLAGTMGLLRGAFALVRIAALASFRAMAAAAASPLAPFALLAIAIAGFAIAFYGARDAGTMSADALIKKWGILGKVWVAGGDALGNLISKLNGTAAASAKADKDLAVLQAKIAKKHGAATPAARAPVDPLGDPGNPKNPNGDAAFKAQKAEKATADARIAALLASTGGAGKAAERAAKKQQRAEEREAARQRSADVRVQKDQLSDLATAEDQHAKAVEQSAQRQIKAMTDVRDAMRGVFSDIQGEFVRLGVIDDPMGPMIRSFEKLLNLGGRVKAVAGGALRVIGDAKTRATTARSQNERLSGLDGVVPTGGGATSGASTPAYMQRMFAHVGERTAVECGQAISNALGSPGFATRVARGVAGRTVRPVNGRLPDGAVVSESYGTKAQHFFITYTDAKGTQRKLESTSAGGTRRYRSDRAVTPRDLSRITRAALPPGAPASSLRYAASTRSGAGSGGDSGGSGMDTSALQEALSGFDAGLTKIAAVDKAWGGAVKNIEGNSVRFSVQTQLASTEFQANIAKVAAATGRSVPDVIRWFRKLANEADAKLNRIKAIDAVRESIADLQKQIRSGRADGNLLAGLDEEMRPGGKFAAADDGNKARLRAETLRVATESATNATRDASRAEADRIKVLSQALPALDASSRSTYAFERAQEDAQRAMDVWRAPDISGLLKTARALDEAGNKALTFAAAIRASGADTFGLASGAQQHSGEALKDQARRLRGRAAAEATTRIRVGKEGAEYTRAVGRTQENVESTQELTARLALLRQQAIIIGDVTRSELSRADAEERVAFVASESLKLEKLGHTPQRAAQLAEERARILDTAKAMERRNTIAREWITLQTETSRVLAAAAQEQGVYLGGGSATQQERALAMKREEARLRDEAATKGYNEGDVQTRLGDFGKRFDASTRTHATEQFAQVAQEAARAQATFGDVSGLAATKFEMAQGALTSLTAGEQKQMLANQAATLGLQRYGEEYSQLYGQQFSLQSDIATQRAQLAGGQSALQQQELQWKMQDLETSARIASMTDEQRAAYERQKPAVETLRDSVRGLLADQQGLKEQGWWKDHNQKVRLSMEPDEIKRARIELEAQLRDSGFTDPIVITAMLDANQALLEAQQTRDTMQSVAQSLSGSMTDIFDNGLGGALSKGLGHIADFLQQASKQIIANFLVTKLLGAFGLGNFLGGMQQAASAGPQISSGGGGFGGAGGIANGAASSIMGGLGAEGSHRNGLDMVPHDGYRAVLHKNEAVLNASDANLWRGLNAAVAASPSDRASTRGGDTNLNGVTIVLPEVRNPEEFAPAVQRQAARLSRRSTQRDSFDFVNQGGRAR